VQRRLVDQTCDGEGYSDGDMAALLETYRAKHELLIEGNKVGVVAPWCAH
jgi:hypothetical protein